MWRAMTDAYLPLAILALFLGAAILPRVARRGRGAAAWAASATMAVSALLLVPLAPAALAGQAFVARYPWMPEWGFDLSFRFDGLGLLFSILILGIGQLILLYATYYMPKQDGLGRLFSLLLAFAGGMLGVVLAENVFLLVVFWEITSLTSFLLIAYKREAAEARIAARMALAVTGGGGLALLAGLILLGRMAGSYELSAILAAGDVIRADPLYPVALVLVLLGCFTKSAQVPFHFWLPNAMAAPTPVSAYLHSATMVKAGIFLLGRLHPALGETQLWFILVGGTGAVTLVYAAYLALLKHDLKGLLAFSTVSHLGLITLLFGMDTPLSPVAAVFHIINHAIFKASLFMAAGIIDHETGVRDMRRLGGLARAMPITAALGIVAAAAMAGVPLLNGFLSKEMFFTEAALHAGPLSGLLPVFATIAGLLSVAYSARFVHDVFFGPAAQDLPRTPHEPPRWMRAPVEVLVVLCLLVGLAPGLMVGGLLTAASTAVLGGPPPPFKLAIWHGFNLPLLMSVLALVGGLVWYWQRHVLFALQERMTPRVASPVAFERAFHAAAEGARRLLAAIDVESVRRSVLFLVLVSLGLGAAAWLAMGEGATLFGGVATPADAAAVLALIALVFGAVGTAVANRRRVVAVILMSVVGLLVSLAFIRLEAPDLALTQLSVEVVSIVLLLLALRYLPGEGAPEAGRRPRGDLLIAGAAGIGTGLLAFAMMTRPLETISGYFLANSVPGGGGTNVVNVILVDFRGFDTLGEITVLAIAALGAHAMLEGLRLRPYAPGAASEADRHPVMLAMLMRPLLPLALAVSAYVLMRGHNLPGGGFIAGLITGIALILQYLAVGIAATNARMRVDHMRLFALGLGLATGTGLVAMAFGLPFLTSAHGYLYPPVIGKTEIASALVFDLGVYVVVVTTVLLILYELGRLSGTEVRLPATAMPAAAGPAPREAEAVGGS